MADAILDRATKLPVAVLSDAIDALGLFYDFRDLTPVGRRAIEAYTFCSSSSSSAASPNTHAARWSSLRVSPPISST